MMSLAYIRQQNEEATATAEKEDLQPFVASHDKDPAVFSCPSMGDYVPDGWEEVNSYFVDSSGLGCRDEPALTAEQFQKKVKHGYGYGLGEVGQFQVHVREFRRSRTLFPEK